MIKNFTISILLAFYWPLSGQNKDWISLTEDVNNSVYFLENYKGNLIAGGHFTIAGNAAANRIGLWNGTNWSNLDMGLRGGFNPYAFKSVVFNDDLYVVGNFDTAGNLACYDIAKWNGTAWSNLGVGSNKGILAIAIYHNEIYVGGTFDSIGGIEAHYIAKWDGQNWQKVGPDIHGFNILDLYVYNDELYALGQFDSIGSISCNHIAMWNGSNWDRVDEGVKTSNVMFEWNGQLLVASQTQLMDMTLYREIRQWNGDSWSLFNRQTIFPMQEFIVFKNKLYGAGGIGAAFPKGFSLVSVWNADSAKWEIVGSGVNYYVSDLCIYKDELYCAGFFNKAEDGDHNYIAKLVNAVGIKDKVYDTGVIIYPNPANNGQITISFSRDRTGKIEIYDLSGRSIFCERFENETEIIIKIPECAQGYLLINITGQELYLSKVISIGQ